jgi:molybdopterin converting factor small subunit
MKLSVLLFGPYADALRASSVEVELPAESDPTAGAVMASLSEQQPKLRSMLGQALLAVNCRCVRPESPVCEGDELAIIGLVGGG